MKNKFFETVTINKSSTKKTQNIFIQRPWGHKVVLNGLMPLAQHVKVVVDAYISTTELHKILNEVKNTKGFI